MTKPWTQSGALPVFTRREALRRVGMGFGSVALVPLLQQAGLAAGPMVPPNPLFPRAPHFKPRAKRVIHIFLNGGVSHVDTFDPKPALQKYAGKLLPTGNLPTERPTGAAFPSPFAFKKYGRSGIEVSEIFPRMAECVDDLAIIRSMHADIPNHEPSYFLMNCG